MAWFKSHPLFSSLVSLFIVIALGCGVFVFATRSATQAARERYEQKKNTLAAFERQQPFPSNENSQLIIADLNAKADTLATLREELQGQGEAGNRILTTPPPTTTTEAYFDLANFVEEMRKKAEEADIGLPPNMRFGFSAYTSSGPSIDRIPGVFRQRLMTEYLLSTLFKSKPQQLVSIQRERLQTATELQAAGEGQTSPSSGSSVGDGGDIFSIDPRISARSPGFIDATAFRITFVGYTGALRAFLNQLVTFEAPVVVRSVEVEPATAIKGAPAPASRPQPPRNNPFNFGEDAPQAPAEAALPLVDQVESRFTVTVEFINLVETQTEATEPTS